MNYMLNLYNSLVQLYIEQMLIHSYTKDNYKQYQIRNLLLTHTIICFTKTNQYNKDVTNKLYFN